MVSGAEGSDPQKTSDDAFYQTGTDIVKFRMPWSLATGKFDANVKRYLHSFLDLMPTVNQIV